MLVVDASALVAYLTTGEHAEEVRTHLLAPHEALWAPHLIDAEVGHVLRRSVLTGELGASTARSALVDLADLPLRRAPHRGLLPRAWALRENLSFYDGLYVALAERLRARLLTLDGRIAGAPGIRASILHVG
ncbi:MAG TPA: type II toxin-antitoxin system VapC family toxin [Solirubrobacteraceae bacterium]|jgi:predicted nucleic acid-binding protein|nr:type II toxin-antitoxin system VapC family toxin [Solirubrobacteraceae bacterium]